MQRFLSAVLASCFCALPAVADGLDDVAGNGPEQDRQAVFETLETYLSVTDAKDEQAIARAFHPAALLMSVTGEGTLNSLSQEDWWARVSTIPDDALPRESTVALIDVTGVAAVARIDITNGSTGATTTDYLNLQKLGEGWRIVNKTLSDPL